MPSREFRLILNFSIQLNVTLRIFRLASWDGVMDLGADYNTNIMNAEVIMDYLNQWKRFMLLIID